MSLFSSNYLDSNQETSKSKPNNLQDSNCGSKKRKETRIDITYDNLTIEFKISQLEFNWGNNVEEWSIRRRIIAEYHPAEDIPPLWLNYDEIPCTKVAVAKYLANSSTITPVGKKFLWKRNSNRRVAIQ